MLCLNQQLLKHIVSRYYKIYKARGCHQQKPLILSSKHPFMPPWHLPTHSEGYTICLFYISNKQLQHFSCLFLPVTTRHRNRSLRFSVTAPLPLATFVTITKNYTQRPENVNAVQPSNTTPVPSVADLRPATCLSKIHNTKRVTEFSKCKQIMYNIFTCVVSTPYWFPYQKPTRKQGKREMGAQKKAVCAQQTTLLLMIIGTYS